MATAAELAIVLKAKDEASAVLKKVSAETASLGKSGDTANKGLAGLASGFKGALAAAAGIAVAVGGVTALTGAVSSAVGSAIDFEKSMSGIKAVSGATGQQMQQLSALALDLGKATSFSAGEAADGISELVKGGVSIGDIFGGAASAALDLAAAGGVSVGEAATIAANAMNQFNLKGADMSHVADLVAGAANASSISVSDFNQSLAAGGSVAAMAGQSIDSFATAVALMGSQGIKGADAGTSLKAAINNLIPTTDAAKAKMRELGLITADGTNQFVNASGGMKSFGEIAEVLQTQTAGLTESQRLLALELIFGSDGMRAAGVLAKQGGEGFDEMAAAMGAAGGAAEIARERLNNAAGDIEQLKGSLETAAITVATLFLPAIRSIAQGATAAVNTAVDEFNTLRASAENIAGAHGLGMIPAALTAIELRIGETLGAGAQRVFHDARAAVENLAAGFEYTRDRAAEMADRLRGELTPAIEGASRAGEGAVPIFRELGETFAATGEAARPLTKQYADMLIQQGLVTAATAELTGTAQQHGAVMDALWAILRNNPISATIDAFVRLGVEVEHAQATIGGAATATDAAWQQFIAGAGAVRDQVVARLSELTAFISTLPARFAADGAAAGLALVTGIVTNLSPTALVQAALTMIGTAIDGARGAAAAQSPSVGAAIAQGMAGGIAGGAAGVVNAAVGLATRAIAAAKAALGVASPSREFEEIGEEVAIGLALGIEGEASAAVDAVEDMVAEMESAAAGFNLVDSLLGDLDTGGQDALANFLRDSERVMEDVGRRAEEIGRKTAEALADAREDAARAIQDVREGAAGRALELVDTQSLSREIRAVRERFGAQQDEASETYERQKEDADATYKFERDLAKAKTADEKAEVRARFREAQDDLQRRRQQDEADRAFRKQQNQELQAFNDRLEDEALQRQVRRLQEERDERIAQITEALDEKTRKVLDQETRERASLAQSASDKLNDLRERFFDKVGPLTEEAKGKFEALFTSLARQVGDAAKAVNDLASALARAGSVKLTNAPSAGQSTWENQPQSVRDMFIATWGAENAKQRWQDEHAAELGVTPGTTTPSGGGGGGGGSAPSSGGGGHSGAGTSGGTIVDWGAYNAANQGKPRNPDGSVKSAYGNPLRAGQASWVGETGPEMFVPATAGRLMTTNQIESAVAGGQHGYGAGELCVVLELDGQRLAYALAPYQEGQADQLVRLKLG